MKSYNELESEFEENQPLKSETNKEQKSFHFYLVFWIGQLFSILGSNIVSFVIIWTITDLAPNNNTILSTAAFLAFIPFVVFVPIAGVLADKWNKKYLILIADSLQAFLTLILILIVIFGQLQIWHIFVLSFLRGICEAFHEPVSFSVLSIMVPKDKLSRMNGINTLFTSLVRIIAPVIAGFLMVVMDTALVLSIDVFTFFIALVPLLLLKIPDVTENKDSIPKQLENDELKINPVENSVETPIENQEKTSLWGNIKEGIRTIRSIPGMMTIMLMATISNFFFQPLDALLPNFIRFEHLGGKPELAYFMGFLQVGIFVGAIIMSIKKKWHHSAFMIILGLFFSSVCFVAIGFIPQGDFILLYIIAAIFLVFNPIVNGLFMTMIQLMIPPEKMGRVFSVLMTMSALASPLGLILAGPMADLLGSISILYILCGILSGAIVALTMFRKSSLGLMKRGQQLQHDAVK
ncbi:MAG: MFS transporter [Promethearchaeota archaeon]